MMAVTFLIVLLKNKPLRSLSKMFKKIKEKSLLWCFMAALKCFGVEFSWFETYLLGREVFAGVFKNWKNSSK